MSENAETSDLEGAKPTADEKFYIEWGRETLKNNIKVADDVIRQFLSLNVAILGGSIVFLNPEVISQNFRWCSSFLFFASLVLCVIGVTPTESKVDARIPNEIKKHKEKTYRHKVFYLRCSVVLLMLGLAVAFLGISMR